jgi:hypothetical protein
MIWKLELRAAVMSEQYPGHDARVTNLSSRTKSLDVLHNIHEAVKAVVSQDVRVPTIGWGGVIDVCRILRDRTGGQGFRVFIKAIKAEPCPQSADPMKLTQTLVK